MEINLSLLQILGSKACSIKPDVMQEDFLSNIENYLKGSL